MTYTLGLDIGIASIGRCLLAEDHIIDLGVRAFDKAKTAKEGESLNKMRRDARLMRHRLSHRAERLKKLARVIYHLVKHRGFHWVSKAEEKAAESDTKSEGGKVKQGLASTRRRMEEKNYRSAAEMVLAEFPQAQRNKRGEYNTALPRILLGQELKDLFIAQRGLGNTYADTVLEVAILGDGDRKNGLFWLQKRAISGEELLERVGPCIFEKSEKRAPKARPPNAMSGLPSSTTCGLWWMAQPAYSILQNVESPCPCLMPKEMKVKG
ncbi:MAG: hypothetical protein LBJ59_06635 [Zoogloeaceae bacterium]|jgi:CRISPR-associated endonuclease Csn1|nr:hypothetical protein [Zoogloeaceae bacterium]